MLPAASAAAEAAGDAACVAQLEAALEALLAQRDRLLLLTPQRRGPWGVETLHRLLLGEAAADPARWPCGTPVICLRNRDDLGLANGDLGVVVGQILAKQADWEQQAKVMRVVVAVIRITVVVVVEQGQAEEVLEVMGFKVRLPELRHIMQAAEVAVLHLGRPVMQVVLVVELRDMVALARLTLEVGAVVTVLEMTMVVVVDQA
jgi:hypothetical protein